MRATPDGRHPEPNSPVDGQGRRRLAYRGAAWSFGVILGLSLAALALSLVVALTTPGRLSVAAEPEAPGLVLVLSIATSLFSLVGLLSTNLLAWRREAREARETAVQLQRQQLEIEKLKLELEKQKRAT
jgi:hypothetical protein